MKRREFVASVLATGITAPALASQDREHEHGTISGPLANAVVSFGAWKTEPPFDRFPNVVPPPTANVHMLFPFEATVKAGGAVSFVISGLHNVQIFAPGTSFEQLRSTSPLPVLPIGPGIVDIAANRIYRGLDPIALGAVQDRIETVQLTMPGRHLVICGLLPHFNDNMHGFVKVVTDDDED